MAFNKPEVPGINEGAEVPRYKFDAFVRFHVYTQQYSNNLIIPVERWVNAVAIKNAGNTILTVMGDPLQPGETKSIGGNAFEIWDEKHFDIAFTNPNAVPVPVNLAVVTQKFYTDIAKASSV